MISKGNVGDMYLADTKVFVDLIKQNKNDMVFFCEVTIFEMMKNKIDSERRRQFKNIISYCKQTGSEPLLSDASMDLFSPDEFYAYQCAISIRNKTAHKMAEMMFTFLNIFITLIQLMTIFHYQKEERIKNAETLIQKTSLVIKELEKQCVDQIYKAFYENSSEKNEADLVVVYNDLINHVNARSLDNKFRLKNITNLSVSEMVSGITPEEKLLIVNQYIDVILDFKDNSSNNKIFFRAYLNYLFQTKNKIELNDFIDLNICYAAYTNNLTLHTTDRNVNVAYNKIIPISLVK